jgi:hypothetical protein
MVVEDFTVNYTNEYGTKHLLHALEARYKFTTDWAAKMYCGLSLAWDYVHRTVDISMPGYVATSLQRFCHTPVTCVQNSLYA